MAQILKHVKNQEDWYKITLYRLIEVSKRAASNTRSKVREGSAPGVLPTIEELITEKVDAGGTKESYYNAIIQTIFIRVGRAKEFIVAPQ